MALQAFQARDYQIAAPGKISACWRAGQNRVVLVSPTGSGKTTIAIDIVAKAVANGKSVLFLAHRRRLIQQIAERARYFQIRYGVIMANLPKGEEWVSYDGAAPLQIASRDTLLSRVMRNGWDGIPVSDLLIVDECHSLESAQYAALADACRVKYRIGLTATPCRADGTGLGRNNWDAIVEAATVPELIAQKYLVPIKCFAPPEVGERRKRGEKVGVAGDPVAHWKRYAEDRPTIGFTSKVAEAVAVRDRYRAAGINAEYVDAKTSYEEREDIIARVIDGRCKVVMNCNIWTEGVDIPELAVCQLLCLCGSYTRFLQAIGRVMRPSPGKEYGILLDHSGATFEHGFPTDHVDWQLDESDTVNNRNERERQEGKRSDPVVCLNCGCFFAGEPRCPECNTPTPRPKPKAEKPKLEHETLVPINGEYTLNQQQQLQRCWMQSLYAAVARNQRVKTAAAIFKSKTGLYPEQTGVTPRATYQDRERFVAEFAPHLTIRRSAN